MDLTLGMVTLGAATWMVGLLSVAFLFCSVLLILTVLIQRPQGGGLSGAFGAGAGSGETAFGARTGDALTIATISFFVIWLFVAVGLVWVMQPQSGPTQTQATSTEAPVIPEQEGAAPEGAGQPAQPQTPADDAQPGTEEPATEQQPAEQPADAPGDEQGRPPDDAGGNETDDTGGPGDGGGR